MKKFFVLNLLSLGLFCNMNATLNMSIVLKKVKSLGNVSQSNKKVNNRKNVKKISRFKKEKTSKRDVIETNAAFNNLGIYL